MKIKNNVKDLKLLSVKEFLGLEFNSLKDEDRNIEHLKNAIIKSGFNFPIFIWANNNFVIDGKGRKLAVEELIAEGYEFDGIPCVEIFADTIEEAKKKTLQASSQYGVVTTDSFKIFTDGIELDFGEFNIENVKDLNLDVNNIDEEWIGMPEVNAQKIDGAVKSIIIHFASDDDIRKFAELINQEITDKTRFMWFPKKEREKIKEIIIEHES